jgi:anti-sigma B factor antagonist
VTASSIDRPISDLVRIHVSGTAPQVRVVADGEIDSTSAPVLREQLTSLLDDGVTDLTVDLTAVSFLDSAGLCVLAATYRRTSAENRRLRILAASRAVIRPLQITGLYDLLQVETVASGAVGAA